MNTERIIEDVQKGLCSYCEALRNGEDLRVDEEGDLVCVRCAREIYENQDDGC